MGLAQEKSEIAGEKTLQLNPKENQTVNENNPESTDTEPAENDNESKESTQPLTILAPTSEQSIYQSDLEKYVRKGILKPMMVGTEDFITLTQKDLHATDKGVMILLPEWQQVATSPKAINYLRQHLPTQGWTTIVLQPLDKPATYPSQTENANTRAAENQEALQAYQEALIPKMKAVFDEAAQYPGIFVVIAEGNNAANVLNLFEQQQLPLPNAFVMLSAHMLTEQGNISLATQVSETELPILDLYLKKDTQWVEHFAKIRKQYAAKEMKIYYRQRQLNNFAPSYYPEKDLSRAIKGWLTAIGW